MNIQDKRKYLREYAKKWRLANPDKWKMMQNRYRSKSEVKNRIEACRKARFFKNPEKYREKRRQYYASLSETTRESMNERRRERRKKLILAAISHYSGGTIKCSVCGENSVVNLCIDHVNNGGTTHRKLGRVRDIGEHLKKHGYPPGYQVLCYNCNYRKELSRRKATNISKKRLEVLSHYTNGSMACPTCGKTGADILTLEHLDGGGRRWRKTLGSKARWSWVVSHNFPANLAVLCWNCNCSKLRSW